MTKVLIVSHAYVVAVNQQKIEALARDKDLKITLLVPNFWKAPLRETPLEKTSDSNYEIISLETYFNGQNDKFLFPFWSLYKLISKVKPDIVHVEEEPWSFSLLEFSMLKKLLGFKLIFFTWENIMRGHNFLRRLVEGFNLNQADGAIAGNSEAKGILDSKGFRKSVIVLPQLGVDIEFFRKKKEKQKKFTVGFIGRLEEQKGIRALLQAIKQLDFSFKLLLIGSGPLKEEIDHFVKDNNLLEEVEVIQGVTHDKIPDYLAKLDVLVLPSITTSVWKEQFGHVLIEAMAGGVPVIGSSSGAIPELIGESGLIFEEGNPTDLVKKIQMLKNNEKLSKELSQKGELRVKDLYTQEKIAKETFRFYQQILGVG